MKCHQYWPNPDSSTTYGDFTVTCHNEEGNSAFLVREMTLTHTQVTTHTCPQAHTQQGRKTWTKSEEGESERVCAGQREVWKATRRNTLGPIRERDQCLGKDEPLRTPRRCVAIVTSVGCSFSGSRCCMRATYWDLVTMTTQPPQSVTLLK